jgi:ATP-binding protein involved in chromosome partitioning
MKELNQDSILALLSDIKDPDLHLSLQEVNAIHSVIINDASITIYLELIPPIHWIAKDIEQAIKHKIAEYYPGIEINIFVKDKEIPRISNQHILPTVKHLIAVSSGKGGVGKSTIAANLAAALAQRGASVGLLDADIYGPSMPTMFGVTGHQMEAEKTEDGKLLGYPVEHYGVKIASIGFIMEQNQAAIMRGPMLAGYFTTLMDQIMWGDLDFLIFDLPPGTGDIQLTLTQRVPLSGAVIVTTPQEISLADVRRSISMFKKVQVDILGVIENMSYFVPEDMPEKKYHIFGEGGGEKVSKESDVPFLGQVPLTLGTRSGGDDGYPVVLNPDDFIQGDILRSITSSIVSALRIKNHSALQKPLIQITL